MTASSGPSLVNIVFLYLSLMGLGAMGGYGGFYWLFSERCSQLMTETQQNHAVSRQQFQKKYEDALEGQRQCMTDTTAKQELSEMQGRLEAQATLADRHQGLLEAQGTLAERHQGLLLQQEETLTRLSQIQASQETSAEIIESLREELRTARADLSDANRKAEGIISSANEVGTNLRQQLTVANHLVEQRTQDVGTMKNRLDDCDDLLPAFRDEVALAKNYLRTRNHQQCKMEYGKGPFIVEFKLNFPETMGPLAEPNVFQVELAPLAEMPHTIFTFLDLVDLQLFDGTSFVASNDSLIEGGHPNHAPTPKAVKLHERYAKFGYGRSPLGFNEYSTLIPHKQFTVGFFGSPVAGPSLGINLMDNSESRGPDRHGRNANPCFGTIISGFDTLQRIQNAPKAADGYRLALNIEIESVRLKRKNVPERVDEQAQEL